MLNLIPKFWRRKNPLAREFSIQRPLVVLHSDDWGRVGVRDKEGYEILREAGVRLGEHPYDFYTLETADDLDALRDMLKRHRDSTGRPACMTMNFVMGNLDFSRMSEIDYAKIQILPLTAGLPGNWKRPGLFETYLSGISDEVFFPSLHGVTHFCEPAVDHALRKNRQRANLLRIFWEAQTPYIHWRMPWVGYEYWSAEKPRPGFLSAEGQSKLIEEGIAIFKKFFSQPPISACAPGYRSNHNTRKAWSKCGIRVGQHGSGAPIPLHIDEFGMLNLHRTIDFEPSQRDLDVNKYLQLAEACFARGVPAVISVHSINFHSSIKDFRTHTLKSLDHFLVALENKFPNLLYLNDENVYDVITRGKFRGSQGMVSVDAKYREPPSGKRNIQDAKKRAAGKKK